MRNEVGMGHFKWRAHGVLEARESMSCWRDEAHENGRSPAHKEKLREAVAQALRATPTCLGAASHCAKDSGTQLIVPKQKRARIPFAFLKDQ